uniref:flocculation protein FLO11-like isoform X2 n=1 Tax=Scatophagus argus TaxID=75038 RepID=UPI001ED7E84E|nr:flocculation protein FLO11-like isoform X2 [Scatophagus argus]
MSSIQVWYDTFVAHHPSVPPNDIQTATVPQQQSSTATACRVSPMELPLGGPALRHYTQSRPRPHRQKLNYRPSRPQETIIESDNEALEFMGRVDEGVEEFFTKRVLPADTLKKPDEESITVHEVAPASSVPCPPPAKTLRRKLGDFFTLKKRRGLKSETSQEGRPKKASIADFIRPLRDKEKDKDRVKEHDKENEKEKAKEHPSAVTGETAVQETPVSGAPPLRSDAVPPRRALREGKSQSLILLSGSSAAGTTNARNTAKKSFEGQHSFEQKLHLMLQRIGVSKAQPGETQNQEGEMKKAESEGTIIDSKPEPPPTFTKPRTMSASSDTRHQIRPSVSVHESAGKPALLPKPVLKPGPPPATSGRNTPENELTQIQEGETNTPTKLSPSAALSTPAAPAHAATTTTAVATISSSVPDSNNFTISPSSTVLPSDTVICTDSVNPPAAATTPTNVTEFDNKPPVPEANANTTELSAASFPTNLTSTATPIEPTTGVSVTSTSSESITPTVSVTSTSTTITTPSISTPEAVSALSNKNQISITSTNLSTILAFPEPNGIISVDPTATPDAISVIATASFPAAIVSVDVSVTTSSVTEASDDFSSVIPAASVTSASSVTKTTSPPSDSCDTITPHTPVTSSSSLVSAALPPTSSTSSTITTTATASPASTDSMDLIAASTFTHPVTPSCADIAAPSTSSSETNPTDTTTTTTSLNQTDTIPTSSATAPAISSPLPTDSDQPYTSNVSTALTPTISDLPATDNTNATSHHLTSSAPSNGSPDKDNASPPSPEKTTRAEPPEESAADEVFEMIQMNKKTETDESTKIIDGGKDSENEKDKPALVNSKITAKEVQEESMKPEEDAVETEVGMAETASGKDCDLTHNEGVIEDQKQKETKSVKEK